MKKNSCINCGKDIDIRAKRCYSCRGKFVTSPNLKGKKHSKKTKKVIGLKSKLKFTEEYKEKHYRSKYRGQKHRAINGYTLVKDYEHPNRNSHNDILEHILIMSNLLNRPLNKQEVVHHINCIRNDNRPENLFLFANRSEHKKCHGTINKLIPVLLEKNIIKFENGRYILV